MSLMDWLWSAGGLVVTIAVFFVLGYWIRQELRRPPAAPLPPPAAAEKEG